MRYKILFTLFVLLCAMHVSALPVSDDIYIYRNDGKFNAFLSHEVDSVVYSKKDLKGNIHQDVVTQEVWTPDSVYRIPLSVIDSISVSAPEIKYNSGVKNLIPNYIPYITNVDGKTISFSVDLPYSLRINKGDILLYEGFDDMFKSGFAGKVTTVSNSGNTLDVVCEDVELAEIYKQYIAVGDYMVQQDPMDSGRMLAIPISRETSLAEFKIPLELNLELGSAVSVTGNAEMALTLKVVLNISNGHTYVDFISKYRGSLDLNINVGGEILKTRNESSSLKFPIKIPPLSILQGELDLNTFIEGRIGGSAQAGLKTMLEGGMSIIYKDGNIEVTRIPASFDPHFDARLGVTGYVWTGICLGPSITTIGHLFELGFINNVGPCFEFNISADLTNGSGKGMYNRLKDSDYSLAVKLGSVLRTSNVFRKNEYNVLGASEVSFMKSTFFLLPEFNNLQLETDKKSITVSTTATRDMLIPCDVGFRLFDDDQNVVETWYNSEPKIISTPNLTICHKFDSDLKQGVRYTIKPLVRLWGVELEASPEQECYLDCNITTGRAYATWNAFEASGKVETAVSEAAEAGFMYTTENTEPRKENARIIKGEFTSDRTFKGGVGGLREGTTYYYCAYIFNDDKYFYGNTQCITTKRNIDRSDAENYGGDYTRGDCPVAETGKSYDIEQKKATVVFTFSSVSPQTECGYNLQADSKKEGKLSTEYHSLGTVTGVQTVELEDLIPGTLYHYWAIEKSKEGKSVGQEKTFETLPSPEPISKVLSITDLKIQEATISCFFDNIEYAEECGIEYVDGEFTYKESVNPDKDGNAEIQLTKLIPETSYSVRTYVKLEEEDEPVFEEKFTKFNTPTPDILGWWKFDTGGAGYAYKGPPFDVKFLNNGRTNNFWGLNFLNWQRTGRKLVMRQGQNYESSTYYEYRGEFNEDFTKATGKVYLVIDNQVYGDYNDWNVGTFYLIRNFEKDSE